MLQGSFFSEGDQWKRERRLLSPAFNVKSIASYAPEVTRMTQTLLQTLQKEALSNAGGQVNFTESPGGSIPIIGRYLDGGNAAADRIGRRMVKLMNEQAGQGNTVVEKLRQLEGDKLSPEDSKAVWLMELIGNLTVLFGAGTDTTSVVLSWAMYHLARDQELQRLVAEEVKDLPETVGPSELDAYLHVNALWMETLRELREEVKLLGKGVPKGTEVMVCYRHVLHNAPEVKAKLGDDLHVFRPARWIGPEGLVKCPPFDSLPFGLAALQAQAMAGATTEGDDLLRGLTRQRGDHWPGTPCLTAMGSSTSEPAEETGLCGVQSPKVAKIQQGQRPDAFVFKPEEGLFPMFHLLGSDAAATPSQLSHRQRLKARSRPWSARSARSTRATSVSSLASLTKASTQEELHGDEGELERRCVECTADSSLSSESALVLCSSGRCSHSFPLRLSADAARACSAAAMGGALSCQVEGYTTKLTKEAGVASLRLQLLSPRPRTLLLPSCAALALRAANQMGFLAGIGALVAAEEEGGTLLEAVVFGRPNEAFLELMPLEESTLQEISFATGAAGAPKEAKRELLLRCAGGNRGFVAREAEREEVTLLLETLAEHFQAPPGPLSGPHAHFRVPHMAPRLSAKQLLESVARLSAIRGVGQSFLTSRFARNEIDFFSPLQTQVTQLVNCTYKLPEPLEESPHASASPEKFFVELAFRYSSTQLNLPFSPNLTLPLPPGAGIFQVAYLDDELLVQKTRLGQSSVNVLLKETD
eukprot:g6520.t2